MVELLKKIESHAKIAPVCRLLPLDMRPSPVIWPLAF